VIPSILAGLASWQHRIKRTANAEINEKAALYHLK
jgi:hypothetical protein